MPFACDCKEGLRNRRVFRFGRISGIRSNEESAMAFATDAVRGRQDSSAASGYLEFSFEKKEKRLFRIPKSDDVRV
jgi:hypothetical protein